MSSEVQENRRDFLASVVVGAAAQVAMFGGALDYRINTKPQEEEANQRLFDIFKGIKPITPMDQQTFLERARPDLYQRKNRDFLGFIAGCGLGLTSLSLYSTPHFLKSLAKLLGNKDKSQY